MAAGAGEGARALPPGRRRVDETKVDIALDVEVGLEETEAPLGLDGVLDEAVYRQVAPLSGFVQYEPANGQPATEGSDAWVFFDAKNVYISVRNWDSHPERAVANELRHYQGPYTLESFDPNLIVALRRAGETAPIGIITYGYDEPTWDGNLPGWQRLVLRNLLHWPLTRFAFISCRDVSLNLPAVRLFRALGVPVTSWTIKSQVDADAALRHADQIVFEGFLPASA